MDAIDDDSNENIIGAGALFDQQIDIVGNSFEGSLQHGFILAVHADADGNFAALGFFEEGDVVILVMLSELLDGVFGVDWFNGMEGVFVGEEALGFVGVEEALGEGIFGDVFVGFVGAEGHLDWLHEANVNEILVFDLLHEVVDDLVD